MPAQFKSVSSVLLQKVLILLATAQIDAERKRLTLRRLITVYLGRRVKSAANQSAKSNLPTPSVCVSDTLIT